MIDHLHSFLIPYINCFQFVTVLFLWESLPLTIFSGPLPQFWFSVHQSYKCCENDIIFINHFPLIAFVIHLLKGKEALHSHKEREGSEFKTVTNQARLLTSSSVFCFALNKLCLLSHPDVTFSAAKSLHIGVLTVCKGPRLTKEGSPNQSPHLAVTCVTRMTYPGDLSGWLRSTCEERWKYRDALKRERVKISTWGEKYTGEGKVVGGNNLENGNCWSRFVVCKCLRLS